MKYLIYEEYAGELHGNQRYINLLVTRSSETIVVLLANKAELAKSLDGHARVDFLPLSPWWRRLFTLVGSISRIKPDLLLVNNERSLLIALLGALLAGIPIAWYVKNLRSSFFVDFICFLFASRVLSIAPQCITKKGVVARMFRRKIFDLPIGIPLDQFSAIPEKSLHDEALKVLMLGAIAPAKGIVTVVDAARWAQEKGRKFEIQIAGATPAKHKSFALNMRHKSEGLSITWLGWQADVGSLLAWADVVILPSYSEGVPRSLVEAMAAGRPVVASRVGGIPSLIQEGVTGMLIEAGDVQGLADALITLANDPDGRQKMGAAARAYAVEHHDFSRHLRLLEQHLAEVAGLV